MLNRILKLPFVVILMGIASIAMFIPGIHAAAIGDDHVMRAFIQSAIIFFIICSLVGIATSNYVVQTRVASHLLALLVTFAILPLMLAVPFFEAVQNTSFLNSYFEMVSSLTTTGASLFAPERLPPSVHLWRAMVGWLGGFFVWVTAIAILAPMNLGGFEVLTPSAVGRGTTRSTGDVWASDMSIRLRRYTLRLFPVYFGLTSILWLALLLAGDLPLVALSHSMATLSTSGISPVGGVQSANSGGAGEFIILLFLVFAISRQTFSTDQPESYFQRLIYDPEMRIGAVLLFFVPVLLFLRHWVGAYEVDEIDNAAAGIDAMWGGMFTVISFLTTTGFQSGAWAEARTWSGLETPGLILMGLALTGGGVATTAGGVKLLRVYSLYKHGLREMDLLVHPSSVGGAGTVARRLRRQGAYVAWIFFMLFALSLTCTALAFSLSGLNFETSTVLAISSLSTTGPLANVAMNPPFAYETLENGTKLIFATAMVLGRLETLAIIALLNPDFWRS